MPVEDGPQGGLRGHVLHGIGDVGRLSNSELTLDGVGKAACIFAGSRRMALTPKGSNSPAWSRGCRRPLAVDERVARCDVAGVLDHRATSRRNNVWPGPRRCRRVPPASRPSS